MAQFIALYRGINVGGRNAVKMEALRAMHESLGHGQVRTYIQSGNVVFVGKGGAGAIAQAIQAAFERRFGFAARVLVVGERRWREIARKNPFAAEAAENGKSVHVAICDGHPDAAKVQGLLTRTGGRERFFIEADVVYLHAPAGFGTSRFAAGLERAAGTPMTCRNWRTVQALAELATVV